MPMYYALSDPHGCLDVLAQALEAVDLKDPDNRLFLLGDVIPHYQYPMSADEFMADATRALRFVKDYCDAHPGQVEVVMGNHEFDLLQNVELGMWQLDRAWVAWLRKLPLYIETERQIFVHAGIEEDAGDLWRHATDDIMFCGKFPPTFGPFEKDIVAGHVGTSRMFGSWDDIDVFWDGQAHYYLDGTTEYTGILPLLIFDTQRGTYASRVVTAEGAAPANPIEPRTPARL